MPEKVKEMKMFFGVTKDAWLAMTKSQRIYLMKRDIERVSRKLKQVS